MSATICCTDGYIAAIVTEPLPGSQRTDVIGVGGAADGRPARAAVGGVEDGVGCKRIGDRHGPGENSGPGLL